MQGFKLEEPTHDSRVSYQASIRSEANKTSQWNEAINLKKQKQENKNST